MDDFYEKKPKGYFKYVLAIDSETTGFNKGTGNIYEGHQAVSWGIIVANAETLEEVEKLYVEIKWNDESKAVREADPEFGVVAEGIHGLTFEYLEENGITEVEAVVLIANLIIKYWGPTVSIHALGHNVASFDVPFMKDMFTRYGVDIKFSGRNLDSSTAGYLVVRSYTSDSLFETMGYDARGSHNSLIDAEMSLGSMRMLMQICDARIKINANE